jgi:hypothetical protein
MEKDGQRIANAEFDVVLPSLENQDPSPDPGLLRELSALTGGQVVDLAGIADQEARFPGGKERREPISSRLDDVWDRWATLLVALFRLLAGMGFCASASICLEQLRNA